MTNRTRRCKAIINDVKCREKFTPKFNAEWWCCDKHRDVIVQETLAKVRVKNERAQKAVQKREKVEFKKETSRRKKKLLENDLSAQKKLTQKAVNKLVLLFDKGKPCISCDNTNPNIKYDAGHYKTVGSHPELRYNLKNINRQCNNYCNVNHSGNINGAHGSKGQKVGIIERYGQERLDYLDGPHERIKYTCADLIEFRKEVNQIIRDIDKGDPFRLPSMYQDN